MNFNHSPKELRPEVIADRIKNNEYPLIDYYHYDYSDNFKDKKVEKYLTVNDNDPDLKPITIDIFDVIQRSIKKYNGGVPSNYLPNKNQIANFDLPQLKQKWQPNLTPKKLTELIKKVETLDDVWSILEEKQKEYQDEINWIATQWYHRFFGYWFYNNGVPTYITGKNYYYINFYEIDTGLPKYRSRDRKYWLFTQFCLIDTRDFKNKNKDGVAVPDENGNYEFYDTDRRICFGFTYPKYRREGATYKGACDNLETISKIKDANGGIQSNTDADAKKVFTHQLVRPWKRMIRKAFFFMPSYEGTTDPKEKLSFSTAAIRVGGKGNKINLDEGLESQINFEVGYEGAYDGWKLHYDHGDEEGKCKDYDVWERHRIKMRCLSENYNYDIHGFALRTSTVGEMEKGGGENFRKLCDASDFYKRNEIGQTLSGMYVLFIPSYEGIIYDEFGNAKIEEAKKRILSTRKAFEENGQFEELNEEVRQHPITFSECFRASAKSSGFNLNIINTRMDELRFLKNTTISCDLIWKDNIPDTEVEIIERNDGLGKFIISEKPSDQIKNRRIKDNGVWCPQYDDKYIAGGDPFRFNKTKNNRKSNGGGAVFYKHDPLIDKTDDVLTWKTHKFVCTYSNRTYDRKEYLEDMLMMCVLFGAKMYPEINVDYIPDYFEERGYAGYLKFDIDKTGKYEVNAGTTTTEYVKQRIFTEFMTYIERHGLRENHIELLNECLMIAGPEDMTNWDRFTAAGLALVSANSFTDRFTKHVQKELENTETQEFIPKYYYRKR